MPVIPTENKTAEAADGRTDCFLILLACGCGLYRSAVQDWTIG